MQGLRSSSGNRIRQGGGNYNSVLTESETLASVSKNRSPSQSVITVSYISFPPVVEVEQTFVP